jgi:hypothetical protein
MKKSITNRWLPTWLLLMLFALFVTSATPNRPRTYVEVIYFYGKVRCKTCIDIESTTKNVVRSRFAKELETRQVVYRTIDFSQSKNKALAKKYQISWSSLILIRHDGRKEQTVNFTNYAFSHIGNKKIFERELEQQIRTLLKKYYYGMASISVGQ